VFSYGSLQRSDVQIATFNRLLDGRRDHLPGFKGEGATLEGKRPAIRARCPRGCVEETSWVL